MRIEHKILETGYHYARAVDHAHLFAQWPVGSSPTSFDVSYGECHPGPDLIREFCNAAYEAQVTAAERSSAA